MFRPRLIPVIRSIPRQPLIGSSRLSPIQQLRCFSSRRNTTINDELWRKAFPSTYRTMKGKESYLRATTTSAFDQFYESFAGENAGPLFQPCWKKRKAKGKEKEERTSNRSDSFGGSSQFRSGPFNQGAFWQSRFREEHQRPGSFRTWRRSHLSSNRRRMRYCKQRKSLRTGLIYFSSTRTGKVQPDYKPAFTFAHPQFAPTQLSPLSVLHLQPPSYSHPPPQYPKPLSQSILSIVVRPPSISYPSIRLLSTSAKHSSPQLQVLQAGIPVLPLLAFLKSSTALSSITWISRLALTFLPFSLRAKLIHAVQEKYRLEGVNASSWVKRMVESRAGVGATLEPSSIGHRFNSSFVAPALLLLPLVLLASILVASFERTPITGRARIIMISQGEEEELVKSILGFNLIGPQANTGGRLDWVSILGNVMGGDNEGVSRTTGRRILLGGEVLDESDWRWRWTSAVLKALEAGIPMLKAGADINSNSEILVPPPPSQYPLEPRGLVGSHQLNAEYDLLVIERQESNAFSFGFGPDEVIPGKNGKRGVIVVYSGKCSFVYSCERY